MATGELNGHKELSVKSPEDWIHAVSAFVEERLPDTLGEIKVESNFDLGVAAAEAGMPWVPLGLQRKIKNRGIDDHFDKRVAEDLGLVSRLWVLGFSYDIAYGNDWKRLFDPVNRNHTKSAPITPIPMKNGNTRGDIIAQTLTIVDANPSFPSAQSWIASDYALVADCVRTTLADKSPLIDWFANSADSAYQAQAKPYQLAAVTPINTTSEAPPISPRHPSSRESRRVRAVIDTESGSTPRLFE